LDALLPLDGTLASAPTALAPTIFANDPTDNYVAQVMPGAETINSMSVSFSTDVAVTLPEDFVMSATIYDSSNGGATYVPVTGLDLPSLLGAVPVGTVVSSNLGGIDAVIPQGDLAIVVISVSSLFPAALSGSAAVGVSYTSG
jgi:hypothetical protein